MSIPIILSTWSFGAIANTAGWPLLSQPGRALDAVEQACMAVESDPSVDSVGRGGLPDARGEVTLDGCIMLSPRRSAGVACIARYLHPVSIARRLMETTPHKLLVGDRVEEFAQECGFPQAQLLTLDARQRWENWVRERNGGVHAVNECRANREEMMHDTVGVLAIDAGGTMAGACSTSGLPFKLPGRVGDSPIIGQGLYVDPTAGGATATGTGELMMGTCASFLAVERMRMGDRPDAAVRAVLERIAASYDLSEDDQCGIIALSGSGAWACGSLRKGFKTAVRNGTEERIVESQFVLL